MISFLVKFYLAEDADMENEKHRKKRFDFLIGTADSIHLPLGDQQLKDEQDNAFLKLLSSSSSYSSSGLEVQSSSVCQLPLAFPSALDVGIQTSHTLDRFGYDAVYGFCRKVGVQVLSGVLNNFKTLEECELICGSFKGESFGNLF